MQSSLSHDDLQWSKEVFTSSDQFLSSNAQTLTKRGSNLSINDSVQDGSFPHIAVIIIATASVVLCGFLIAGWVVYRKRTKKKSPDAEDSLSLPDQSNGSQQPMCIIHYPIPQPDIKPAEHIQPNFLLKVPVTKAASLNGSPTPIRSLRARRGLLERRGSHASLTLDLGLTRSMNAIGSPPRESAAEEYLQSAGNRMSRKELRNCLKDVNKLNEEFWEIPMNHPDKIVVAGSGTKNRYRTIIPNEKTRVVLPEIDEDELSTYINANFIRGYAGEPRAYIATQGPMTHTVEDFWRMVWLVHSPAIVMITKLQEKNKAKCEVYLPEQKDSYFGIEVEVLGETSKPGYVLKQLLLRCNGEERHLLHYWYTSWPDHKAPGKSKQLLDLVKEVDLHHYNSATNKYTGPLIVHCSAGIGRTGCFIAASVGRKQLKEERMVDILRIVCNMRLDRGGMVQTIEQYQFIHQVLHLYEQEQLDEELTDEVH